MLIGQALDTAPVLLANAIQRVNWSPIARVWHGPIARHKKLAIASILEDWKFVKGRIQCFDHLCQIIPTSRISLHIAIRASLGAVFIWFDISSSFFWYEFFLYLSNLIKNYLTTFPDGTQKRQQFHNYDGSQKSKQVPPSSPSFISPWRIESMFEQFRGTISSPNYVTTIATTTTWRVTGKNSHWLER